MRLKQLKIAGFKSFVDPTVVHFSSQLVAVVGPNGCGKSNIIDAVRWVMGESSAKSLRGESMTDVIFNGASNRKPVGQASVELLIDNSLGRLLGPFANYGELSVKRIVNRDGDSTYHLNGSRCRRRDVTDLFLGTGTGTRGYSIIGQGTISRLIEAKPEELRAYLEEAAGVSKYKERRRETFNRIAQTQEHLTRVADIREELDKQLQRLERQAKAAERYALLKKNEALCRAELMAFKWQAFEEQKKVKQNILGELNLQHEEQQSVLTKLQTQKIVLQEQQYQLNNQVQTTQALFYQIGTEVARLEEGIQQQRREQKRLDDDRQQAQVDWQKAQDQLKHDEEQVKKSQQRIDDLQEQLELTRRERDQQEMIWQQAQDQASLSNEQWQEAHTKRSQLNSDLQIVQVSLKHAQQNQQAILLRLEKVTMDKQASSLQRSERRQTDLDQQQCLTEEEHSVLEAQLNKAVEDSLQQRFLLQEAEQRLHESQSQFHRAYNEFSSLNAVQQAALQRGNPKKSGKNWEHLEQLTQKIQVEPKWQYACEQILGGELQAYVVDDFSNIWSLWSDDEQVGGGVVTLKNKETFGTGPRRARLIDKMLGSVPVTHHDLEHIYAANHLEEAKSWFADLQPHESIITPTGLWLGIGWIKSSSLNHDEEQGLLARQQKITELASLVHSLQNTLQEVQVQRDLHYERVQEALSAKEALQLRSYDSHDALRKAALAAENNRQDINRLTESMTRYVAQEEELHHELAEGDLALAALDEQLTRLLLSVEDYEVRYRQLTELKDQQRADYLFRQHAMDAERKKLNQVELEFDREVIQAQQLILRINREQEQLVLFDARLQQLATACSQAVLPEQAMQARLDEFLSKHHELEQQLLQSNENWTQIKKTLDELDKKMVRYDQDLRELHDLTAQTRMEAQALSVRASAIQESLDEHGLFAKSVYEAIPPGVTPLLREEELLVIYEKIKRLGAINLAAIDEFTSEQQRKHYLDEQYADLSEALTLLQTAIDTMDKETKIRLESTFDEVNASFKVLFPRLFGGGRAQLELTCDNLLEAGILVMAQPPGKRNSTIHLLSGGEKAMTAVALVFAIFQLNPSPFCMLDEVDAPLDDVNVGRFCDLVKEMSQFVQFLFITHNKVTMELADHLIGVTMREPGVSRLVTVDVKESLTME